MIHPVIYADKKTDYEEKIWINASLYPFDEIEFGLVECRKENRIKTTKLFFFYFLKKNIWLSIWT